MKEVKIEVSCMLEKRSHFKCETALCIFENLGGCNSFQLSFTKNSSLPLFKFTNQRLKYCLIIGLSPFGLCLFVHTKRLLHAFARVSLIDSFIVSLEQLFLSVIGPF